MTVQLHNSGEEFIMRHVFVEDVTKPTEVTVGLFNDATDALVDSDNLSAITTEPTGTSYARQSVAFGSGMSVADNGSGDWLTQFDDVVFDVSDSAQTIDAALVVVNYQATGDASANDHLMFTVLAGDSSTDLSQINGTLTLSDVGFSLD